MLNDGKGFDTNIFFAGGAGMFLQYHDIVKPIYLYAILKMIAMDASYGLPLNIVSKMSMLSLIEWYVKRRYINPLRCLDPLKIIDPKETDDLMNRLLSDGTIHKLSSGLNIELMMDVYRKQNMQFPIYVYSKEEDPNIEKDCKDVFSGIGAKYVYGDLKTVVSKCDQNFTYILSDIEMLKELCGILYGTYSHILLAREYRYNYKDSCKTFKYDIAELARSHPFIRIGTIFALDPHRLALSLNKLISQGEGDS